MDTSVTLFVLCCGVLLRLFIWFVVCLECVCVCLFVYISACLRVCVAFRLELRQVKTYCKPGGLHQCTLVPAWPVKTHKPDNYLLPHCSPDGFIQYALHHGSIPIHVFPLATSLRAIATIVTLALLGPLIQSLTQSLLFRFLIHIVQFLGFGIWIPGFSFKIWNCLDVVLRFYDSCFWIHGVKSFIIPFLEILFRYYLVKQCESRCLDGSIPGCWLFTGGSPGMSQ